MTDGNVFVISSDNFKETIDNSNIVCSVYGYLIMNNGEVYNNCFIDHVINEKNILHGGYCLIKKVLQGIEISTDKYGNGMIFLYRKDDFFAISNSLYILMNYLKGKHQVTLNKNYIDFYFAITELATMAYT